MHFPKLYYWIEVRYNFEQCQRKKFVLIQDDWYLHGNEVKNWDDNFVNELSLNKLYVTSMNFF